jgi:hypothetical protein
VTADNFNVVADPDVDALRYQIDCSRPIKTALKMHKAANIGQEVGIDRHA